jgi:hypothetical protein
MRGKNRVCFGAFEHSKSIYKIDRYSQLEVVVVKRSEVEGLVGNGKG